MPPYEQHLTKVIKVLTISIYSYITVGLMESCLLIIAAAASTMKDADTGNLPILRIGLGIISVLFMQDVMNMLERLFFSEEAAKKSLEMELLAVISLPDGTSLKLFNTTAASEDIVKILEAIRPSDPKPEVDKKEE
jgi:hypothetical protein